MLIETVELTMSHVGLGCLSEVALMTMFGNAHSHALTQGTSVSASKIVDASGALLYPAYYLTHLKVPAARPLRNYKVWDTVSVGISVQSFGGLLLDSTYMLAPPREIPAEVSAWDLEKFPSMRAGNTFTIDGVEGEPRASTPAPGQVAALPKMKSAPPALNRFRDLRGSGKIDPQFNGRLTTNGPTEYALVEGRDIVAGHGVMFSMFVTIMDYVERDLLAESLVPSFPTGLLNSLSLLERETCYFGNLRGAQVVEGYVRSQLVPCPENFHGDDREVVSAGILTSAIEIYQQRTKNLLVVSKSRKLFAVPREQQGVLADAKRMLFHHGQD